MWRALCFLLAGSSPAGAEPGSYHPDYVAPHSQLFARAGGETASRFDQVQVELDAASSALSQLDRDVALCGARADKSLKSYAAGLRKETAHSFHVLQAFVDVLTQDFEQTFGAALERALPAVEAEYEVSECKAQGVYALMGRNNCAGKDLNPLLAQRMDADEALKAAVEEILTVPWPQLELTGQPQAAIPITGQERVLRMAPLVEALYAQQVKAVQSRLEEAMEGVEAVMEESDDQDEKKKALAEGQALRALYEQEMAARGEVLMNALAKSLTKLEKKGAAGQVALCPNPEALGGCQGQDVTAELLPLLQADRRLVKTLAP